MLITHEGAASQSSMHLEMFSNYLLLLAKPFMTIIQLSSQLPHVQAAAASHLAMADYLEPPPESNNQAIAVIMGKMICQVDLGFRNLLQKVRDGMMDDEAVDFLLG
jgi:hypothetical protein